MPVGHPVPPLDSFSGAAADYSMHSTLGTASSLGSHATLHSVRDSDSMEYQSQPRTVTPQRSTDDPSSNLNMHELHIHSFEPRRETSERVQLEITSQDLPIYLGIQKEIDRAAARRQKRDQLQSNRRNVAPSSSSNAVVSEGPKLDASSSFHNNTRHDSEQANPSKGQGNHREAGAVGVNKAEGNYPERSDVKVSDKEQGTNPSPTDLAVLHNVNNAQAANRRGNKREAIRYYKLALADIEKAGESVDQAMDKRALLGTIHNNVGNCYMSTNQLKKSMNHLKEALRLRTSSLGSNGDNGDLALTNFNLGNLYYKLDQGFDGLPHYKEAVRIYANLAQIDGKYRTTLARAHKAVGQVSQNLGYFDESVESYEKSKKLFSEATPSNGLTELQSVTNNLGNVYEDIGEYSKAQECLKQSLDLVEKFLAEKGGDVDLLNRKADCLNNLGVAYKSAKKLEEAAEYLAKCVDLRLELIQEHGSSETLPKLCGALRILSRCWSGPSHDAQAKAYFTRVIEALKICPANEADTKSALLVCYECIGETGHVIAALK